MYLYTAVASIVRKTEENEYDGGNVLLDSDAPPPPRPKARGLFAIPSRKECVKFSQFAGPLFLISCGRGALIALPPTAGTVSPSRCGHALCNSLCKETQPPGELYSESVGWLLHLFSAS